MACGRACNGGVRGVLVFPDFFAVGGLEAEGGFLVVLNRKDVKLVADEGRGGIAQAHGDFPLFGQVFRPGGGRVEAGDFSVAVGAAPLGPVLRKTYNRGKEEQANSQQSDRTRGNSASHRNLPRLK